MDRSRRLHAAAAAFLLMSACGGEPEETDAGARDAASAVCVVDADCDDGLFCSGLETCAPGAPGADASGCVPSAIPCAASRCDEAIDACGCDDAEADADGDGHDAVACGGDDCDDEDANRFPGNTEVCDAEHDEDCDPTTVGARDVDEDGATDVRCCNGARCGDDCDDGRTDRAPANVEACDGADNDCDDGIDEGIDRLYYRDADGDGFGDAGEASAPACAPPSGFVASNTDCDDARAARNPSAPEVCDALDNDCDERVDEDVAAVDWYVDQDGDGYGTDLLTPQRSCVPVTGRVFRAGDCDDGVASRSPGAPEVCDRIDNDCDEDVDEGVGTTYFRDVDGDLFGDATETTIACSAPDGYVVNGGDCDDGRSARNPGLGEICDDVPDNDCDPTTFTFDGDRDGFDVTSCGGSDCDDTRMVTYPGAPELCDRHDNPCAAGGGLRAMEDADEDGVAPDGVCTGGPLPSGDCNDASAAAHPGGTEVCDGVDNDCNGVSDDAAAAAASCNRTGTVGACVAGTCSIDACQEPYRNCDGSGANGCEANLDDDVAHCGSCSNACPAGAGCFAGTCQCGSSAETVCAGACVDVLTSVAHCGGCGSACPVGATCDGGTCECDEGLVSCGSRCVDLLSDNAHCGACGESCFGGSCGGGECQCAGSMPAVCSGTCRDLASDNLHCGACGETCLGGSCAGGACSCGGDETLCEGACIDTESDVLHCGGCDTRCVAGASCGASACSPSVGWLRTFTGTGSQPPPAAGVVTHADGDVSFLVHFDRPTDLGGGAVTPVGPSDVAVVRYGADGAHRWTTALGSAAADVADRLVALPDGGVALTFRADRVPHVARLGAGGAVAWDTEIPIIVPFEGTRLAAAPDGSLVFAAGFTGMGDPGNGSITSAGERDVVLLGIDPAGAVAWAHTFGGIEADAPSGIAVDAVGRIYVLGTFGDVVDFGGGTLGSNGPSDAFLLALDADRSFRWVAPIGGPGRDGGHGLALGAAGLSVIVTYSGDITVAGDAIPRGSTSNARLLAQWSSAGTGLWARTLGDLDQAGLVIGPAGALHMVGGASGKDLDDLYPGVLDADDGLVVTRFDPADGAALEGLLVVAGQAGGVSIAVAIDGTRYVAGVFSAAATFPDGSLIGPRAPPDGVLLQLLP